MHPLRLLIIEDSEDDALLIERELTKNGYNLDCRRVDTPEALQSELIAKEWDIVISDFVMPRFSGLDALKMLKGSGIDIPFIVVSGKIGEETAVEAMRAGAQDYIIKGNLARLAPAVEREMADAEVRRRRRQAEEGLRNSEGRYQRLLESVTDYIYTALVEDGRPVATTHGPGCESVTGYTSEEFTAKPGLWLQMVHEDDRTAVLEQADSVLTESRITSLEHRIIHKDGRVRWIRNTPVPRYNREGRLIAYDGIVADITERKLAEEERYKIEQQFQQTQKLESLGVLSGGIAHDFNNILTVILGHCSMAKVDCYSEKLLEEHFKQIEIAANRAADLCRQMLTYAGKSPLQQTQVNMWLLIDETVKLLQSAIKKNVTIDLDLNRDVPEITGDNTQIQQVVMNLIINAAEAIDDKSGTIKIALARKVVTPEQDELDYLGTAIMSGAYACLEVSDNGCGMDEVTKMRIFEPFFTTKFTGRGLGMSAILGIIKSHAGALQLSSTPGVGTNFKVYFPLSAPSAAVEKAPLPAAAAAAKANGTILLADDEDAVRSIGAALLKALGFSVITASNGREALEIHNKRGKAIDLALLDLIMPEMSGLEAYRELRKITATLPVVICSGYSIDNVSEVINNDEHAGFVHKPYKPGELRDVLIKLLVGAR